jgi:hypothetical protein
MDSNFYTLDMWGLVCYKVFSIQRGPAEKMKEKITEMA